MNYLTEEQSANLDDFYQGFTLDALIEIIEEAEANTQYQPKENSWNN